ncbi:CARDB domain-containing protein [Paenibacillus macerans]|uniref:CARDB domain-containing protein n=1 Tax=Paenibacillus macerans TaxID=44252 RepID=UPI00056BF9FB|nr:CARDB domain-containing protein [Paenibacillus macerans]MCY7558539.1 hypothetical protein [Paenibacillus macerans]MEC0153953.1 CARDB domain-containing protein [Paenibacillus macerans]
MKKSILVLTLFVSLSMLATSFVTAANTPMLSKYVEWNYGDSWKYFSGYIPALDKRVTGNPWELYRWTGIFNFKDGGSSTIRNYDVFNVKDTPDEPSFKKENGFGLVYKSPEALGDLFDAVWSSQTLGAKQRAYFRKSFTANADDPVFKNGHDYYYLIQKRFEFLRTAGIITRMGAKFDQTKKLGEDDYQAIYQVSKWPTIKVTQGNALNISFTSSGYSERNIRLVAIPKGAFPDFSKIVSLTDGKLINTSEENYSGSVQINANDISKVLGPDVDIIIDDGYGRTAIENIKLPDAQPMDYVPTKLTLTEGGQLWVKFRYDGEDIVTSDYINERGMPMTTAVKIGGVETKQFNLSSMYTSLPATLKKGQELSCMFGKIELGDTPGKYYIKVDTTINNPNHPDRALESPVAAYENNTIRGEWTVEVKEPPYDLIAESITASPDEIEVGGKTTITAKVKNIGKFDQKDVLIRFSTDGETIYEARKKLTANKTQSVGPFQWQAPKEGIHGLTVHVDPEHEKEGDTDPGNNIASTSCLVTNEKDVPPCNNGPKTTENWKVTYEYITRIIPENTPVWKTKTVYYNERLNLAAEVNTKQGVKTDPDRPKESDRESRGSWEIIPWAKKNRLDPNEVTRAGYGFEIKATTSYWTDWETEIPKGLRKTAKPFGGEYYGPDEVTATIRDTKGRLVKVVKLEKTSGDRNNATWELPEQEVKSESGKVYKDRKFYTDINVPDGNYTITITTSRAGMHGLVSCVTKKVRIYGSMYDDVQNLRSDN